MKRNYERVNAMVESYKRCKSTTQVAHEFGVTRGAVTHVLKREGVERSLNIGRPKTLPPFIVCENCGERFESRYSGKRFCTLKCYTSSKFWAGQQQQRADKMKRRARIKAGLDPDKNPVIICINCGAEREVAVGFAKQQKYCNRRCYREYMAKRFDRYIANPESVALPQNYDEFLTKDELPCLIKGCGWLGVQLSHHMNFTHGIKKQDFKRLAGFNATTGVITAAYSQQLSDSKHKQGWGSDHMAHLRALVQSKPSPPHPVELRLEGKEHFIKAHVLMRESRPYREMFCVGCGTAFFTNAAIRKWCSIDCRDEYNRRRLAEKTATKVYSLTCSLCKQPFRGNIYQKQRSDVGLVVVCGRPCRGRLMNKNSLTNHAI